MTQIWTIKSIMEWTATHFTQLGLERPRYDTEILLASSLGVDRLWLYTHYDRPLDKEELSAFRKCVIRRSKREPLQYILGKWTFWSSDFILTPNVLIPRKETEHIVELVISLSKSNSRILDLCTGCGNIVISLAKELPQTSFIATDLSFEALKIARRNASINHVIENIVFIQGDLFTPLKKDNGFDMVLCNPPYIPTKNLADLQPEVRDFEPKLALDGGEDGLAFFRCLIPDAIDYIKPSGHLIMEIDSGQSTVIQDMLNHFGYHDIEIIKDFSGLDRVAAATH